MRSFKMLGAILALYSCSLVQKIGLRTAAPMVSSASYQMQAENNFDYFEKAAPGNLLMLEGLWSLDKSNRHFLEVLIKGHTGLAFGVMETRALAHKWQDSAIDNEFYTAAIYHYTRAIEFGILYLKNNDIDWTQIARGQKDLKKELENLDKDDRVAMLYMGQALAGLMNLQRTDIVLAGQLPFAQVLVDWSCAQDMKIEFGACSLYYALLDLSRPKMLGGDPEKGAKRLAKLIGEYPQNQLLKIIQLQFEVIPNLDEEKFDKIVSDLKLKKMPMDMRLNYRHRLDKQNYDIEDNSFALFNAIAFKRLEILEKNKKEIF